MTALFVPVFGQPDGQALQATWLAFPEALTFGY